MTTESSEVAFAPGLHMIWWERSANDKSGVEWGQLAGSVNRLGIVIDGLEQAARRRDAAKAFNELTFYLENYFVRVYELRERAIALVESFTGFTVGAAKKPERRAAALSLLTQDYSDLHGPFGALLELLDSDIDLRNKHTHNHFIDLQLVISPSEIYEPDNVLLETGKTSDGAIVRRVIRREVRRLSLEYGEKALLVRQAASALLEVAHTRIMPGTA